MKKTVLFVLSLFACFYVAHAQQICIAFYNQENLFDTINDPLKNDDEFLPTAKKAWNTQKYTTKISQMAKVISSINNGQAPDVLGMCEVENLQVLNDLIGDKQLKSSKFKAVHVEGPDERSIDNALLYNTSQFKLIKVQTYPVIFADKPESKTRDVLFVELEAKNKTRIVFLVNHFPSRLGGEKESEPRRWAAAKVVRNICDSLYALNLNREIIIMGDFNDEPNNSSMDSVMRAKGNEYDLNGGNLFNCMYELKQNGEGSHYYRGQPSMLDQIIISAPVANCTGKVCYVKSSATIFKQPWMFEQEGKFKGSPLRTYAGDKYLGGFSDHMPVFIYLTLKK
ncbi:MAG: endonuclease/exonuclease/phosphatase family protein [Bacteroidia bacterium]|jgi:predicted extracellular nuclease|nr:endonuclease/exonuclease/phosphatase family protein [Bacteroidia bacterium]